jgi:hypothetical protein
MLERRAKLHEIDLVRDIYLNRRRNFVSGESDVVFHDRMQISFFEL